MREGPELQKGKGFVSRILISANVILAASSHLVRLLAGKAPTARINSIKGKHESHQKSFTEKNTQLIDNNDIFLSILLFSRLFSSILSRQLRKISLSPSIHDYSFGRSYLEGWQRWSFSVCACLPSLEQLFIHTDAKAVTYKTVEIAGTSKEDISKQTRLPPSSSFQFLL